MSPRRRYSRSSANSFVDNWLNIRQAKNLLRPLVLIILTIASIGLWIYFIALGGDNGTKIMIVEGIVFGAILVVSMIFVFLIGYDEDPGTYLKICFTAGIILSVVGYYVAGLNLISSPERPQGEYIFFILQLLLYVIIAAVMAVLPLFIICGIRHLIIKTFDIILR